MTDQATGEQPTLLSLALAEPSKHVRGGWIAGLGLASLAMWMASLTPLQVLIPEQLQAIDPKGNLGIINIAIVGPAALGAAISGLLVQAGGYPTMFAATAVVAAIGSILVWKIRSVP